MSNRQETVNAMVLAQLCHYNASVAGQVYRLFGSATAAISNRHNLRDAMPEATDRLAQMLQADDSEARQRAEQEADYAEQHGIATLVIGDKDYPGRLGECDDAPLLLLYKGSANLNSRRVVSIVGTRNATVYGKTLIERFVADMKSLCPDVLIVSGLAYGVDICAHRSTLDNGRNTVAVLAHGLDDIYPSLHRDTANRMTTQGGLLTEYPTHTRPDKRNFVQRNRIVAGMSDACIVVESAAKGGGLITAGIARSYNRDVFAFPGNVGSKYSEGCNKLIRDNAAALITSAADFASAMGWNDDSTLASARRKGIERELFPDLSEPEAKVVSTLRKNNDLQINMLSAQADIPIAQLSPILFGMEMKGLIRTLAGGTYHLMG